ncbi:MAG: DUF6133 family protein [Clostridia bacterium]
MKNSLKKLNSKANKIAIKTIGFKERAKQVLSNNSGEASISTAITILISVVIGALLLAGLYSLFEDTIMPTVQQHIEEMFDYAG